MKYLVGLLAALALLQIGAPVQAQEAVKAVSISACGTPGNTPVAGVQNFITMDLTGKLCENSSISSAQFGTQGTGASYNPPTGGSGLMGQLSWLGPIYSAASGPIPAGTQIIGRVGIDQTTPGTTDSVTVKAGSSISNVPITTGGLSSFTLEPAASDNHTVIKNGAGQVYHINAFNNSGTINYYRLYDAGTGFNGCNSATNLKWEGHIPANTSDAGFVEDISQGVSFSTGISICVTSGYGQTNTANATASAISLNVGYK